MELLLLLLGLTYNSNCPQWNTKDYDVLWKKVEVAESEGKPQTAVSFLKVIAEKAKENDDLLELLYCDERIYDNLAQYNWKERNIFGPEYYALRDSVYSDLDANIVKFARHRRVIMLISSKIDGCLDEAEALDPEEETRYKEIKKMCAKAIELFPHSDKVPHLKSIIEEMDATYLNMSCEKNLYPGSLAHVGLYTKNISKVEISVFRLADGFSLRDNNICKKGPKSIEVKKIEVGVFKNLYNIREEKSVEIEFPEIGKYAICCKAGSKTDLLELNVSRIATAVRTVDNKYQVYAADAVTGKPYETIKVAVLGKNEEYNKNYYKEKVISSGQYEQDGFTTIDQTLFENNNRNSDLRVEIGNDVYSPLTGVYSPFLGRVNYDQQVNRGLYIYTDRMLYKPSDTVYFKVIAYEVVNGVGKVVPDKKVKLQFFCSSEKGAIATANLITNDMGSASGTFAIPEDAKNGLYNIISDFGGKDIRVETYKRPTFFIEMEKVDNLYGFGDVITQKGNISSYSGVAVEGAKVSYKVVRSPKWSPWWRVGSFEEKVMAEGILNSDKSGDFEVSFKAIRPDIDNDAAADFMILATVTDLTGETHSSEIHLPVSDVPVNVTASFDASFKQDSVTILNKLVTDGVTFNVQNLNNLPQEMNGVFQIVDNESNNNVVEGEFKGNEKTGIDFKKIKSGYYTLFYSVEWRGRKIENKLLLALFSPEDKAVPYKENALFFTPLNGKNEIDFMIGTGESDLYLEVELFDKDNRYYRESIHLQNEMRRITLPFSEDYPKMISLSLFAIRGRKAIERDYIFEKPLDEHKIDMEINSFRDKTTPGREESFTVKAPASELTVSIFDITTDRYGKNKFPFSPFPGLTTYNPSITTNLNGGFGGRPLLYLDTKGPGRNDMIMMSQSSVDMNLSLEEKSADLEEEVDSAVEEEGVDEEPRNDFGETIAFYPHIRVPENGEAEVNYKVNDALSTYRVLILAHTSELGSASEEKSFIVQKELMVLPNLPLFVTEGDKIVLKSKIVNLSDKEMSGKATIELFDKATGEKLKIKGTEDKKVSLIAGEQGVVGWNITVPASEEGINVVIRCKCGSFSDGEKHYIEVISAQKEITETAAFITGGTKGRKYYEKQLQKEFGASDPVIRYEEYSSLTALKEALQPVKRPESDNMISWLTVFYINQIRGFLAIDGAKLDEKLNSLSVSKLSSLQKSDGGFSWFPGMDSSDILTKLYLEKMYCLERMIGRVSEDGLKSVTAKAVKYLDSRIVSLTSGEKWEYSDLISYFSVRQEYSNIEKPAEVEKAFKTFLEKSKDGWQKLPVLEKAQLCRILSTCDKKRSDILIESLKDYAVENETTGCYFPNAVMPFRGLMHTEIYAHCQLLDLFVSAGEKKIAKGISQWILMQKHNQAWENEIATADAVYALVINKVDDLKFGAVYYTYRTPLREIKASSSEIELKRSYTLAKTGEELKEGDKLNLGDEVIVKYQIRNSENRSFVEMKAMRPACFYPVEERSGYMWYGWYGAYRENGSSMTKYYFQLLPEEISTFSENFYVTQEGIFTAGIAEIESVYATEYRGHTESRTMKADD